MRIRPPTAVSRTSCRVSHEDTDAGGVVRSATCLRFFERGWTEHLRERGFSVNRLLKSPALAGLKKSVWDFSAPREELAGRGLIFPVVRVEVRYRAPAVYDDLLSIESRILELGRTSVTFGQKVLRAGDDALLCEGEVTLVCVGPGMKARRMPDELRSLAPSPAFPREPA